MNNSSKLDKTKVVVKKTGTIVVSGDFDLFDSDNIFIFHPNPKRVSLCGCGKTKKQPFCDGSHKTKKNKKSV